MAVCNNSIPQNWIRFRLELFLVLAILVGNLSVILSVLLVKVSRKPKNYLLLSLAIADFLVGILVLPTKIYLTEASQFWVTKNLRFSVITSISGNKIF
jgi:hypothetical protein